MGIRRILAPTDLTDVSGEALTYAAALARAAAASVVVLYVAQAEAVRGDPAAAVDRFVAGRLGPPGGHDVEVATALGDPREEIARYARAHACDLIVMATHATHPGEGTRLGSVARYVAETSPVPVLVTKPGAAQPAIARMLAPTDFSPDATAAISWAGDLARRLGARLTVLHVAPPLEEASLERLAVRVRDQVDTALVSPGAAVEIAVGTGDPVEGIVGFMHLKPTSLVVVASHRRPGEMRASVAARLLDLSRAPVAVLHPRLGVAAPTGPERLTTM